MHTRRAAAFAGLSTLWAAALAGAQCTPAWQDVGGMFGSAAAPNAAIVYCLDAIDNGALGRRLFLGGDFLGGGTVTAIRAASRDARFWQSLGSGIGNLTTNSWVYGVSNIDPPAGSAIEPGVVFSGIFFEAGGTSAQHLARWASQSWGSMDWEWSYRYVTILYGGPGTAFGDVLLYSGGTGTSLHGTLEYTLAQWDGRQWSPTGGGLSPLPPQTSAWVRTACVYDDDGEGARPAGLYVGGNYWYAGGIIARNIARWDGTNWETLGTGVSNTVESLCVFDADGSGPQPPSLFVGGQFALAGSVPNTDSLARWDGTQWHEVSGWNSGPAKVMTVFDDDGPGPRKPAIFIGGLFNVAGGVTASRIIRWDGQQWSQLMGPTGQPGVSGWGQATEVHALAVFDEDGDGPNPGGLYVGGFFTHAGGVPMNSIARWGCPAPAQCYANCSLDFHPVTGAHILSVADFGCFQTKFVQQDPYADCNTDGALTVADFGCFQTRFVAGCP